MKRCAQCGKRKFFLYENTDICYSCHEANIEAERLSKEKRERFAEETAIAETEKLYQHMREIYAHTELQFKSCTLADARTAVQAVDEFVAIIEQTPSNPHLLRRILQDCQSSNYPGKWYHDLFGYITLDSQNNVYLSDLIARQRDVQKRAQELIDHSETYSTMISSLTEIGFPILDMSQTEQKSYDVFPLNVTNITARSSVARLSSFIVIDLETTGLSPVNAEIIQIAAVQFTNFSTVKCFSTFVKPRKGLNPSAQRVNGITEQDVETAPYIEQVIPALDELLGAGLPIVGHNLTFDANFLLTNGSRAMWEITRGLKKTKCYDTLELARKTYGWCAAFKLDYLCRDILHIIREDSHKASSDALATGLLFHDICRRRIGPSVPDLET